MTFYPCAITKCIHPPCDGFPRHTFEPDDIKLFSMANAHLNEHVLMAVEPCYILLSFLLMPSVAPYSQPTTYHMFNIMQLMMFFGEIPHGPNTGRKMYGFSQSTSHRALAIGWYALLIFHSSSYSFLTVLPTGHPGRRTSRYSCNVFHW